MEGLLCFWIHYKVFHREVVKYWLSTKRWSRARKFWAPQGFLSFNYMVRNFRSRTLRQCVEIVWPQLKDSWSCGSQLSAIYSWPKLAYHMGVHWALMSTKTVLCARWSSGVQPSRFVIIVWTLFVSWANWIGAGDKGTPESQEGRKEKANEWVTHRASQEAFWSHLQPRWVG